jgi:hypothetical protein
MSGDLASWEVHMNGLEKIIEIKGGPQTLGLDGLMHHIIYRYRVYTNLTLLADRLTVL